MSIRKLYSSAPLEPVENVNKKWKKKTTAIDSSNTSNNNVKDKITYLEDDNRKPEKIQKKS